MMCSDIYVLKITPYRESSNLYEAVAKDYGKLTLMHKGVKANNRRNSLELFTSYKINFSGKGSIKFLRDSEIIERKCLSEVHKIIGMYFNELMFYLTKNDYQIERLYDHYDTSLGNLSKSDNYLEDLNTYEIGILILVGHYLIFDQDIDGKFVEENYKYSYIPEQGPVIDLHSKNTYSGKTLMALSGKYSYDSLSIRESRLLMKRLIDYYIQPKKIITREILRYISLK